MVKRVVVLLVVIVSFTSCCDIYYTSMRGRRSKRKYKPYIKHRIDPNIIGISTNVIYEEINFAKEEGDGHVRPILDPVLLTNTTFFLFLKDGNCYSFTEDTMKEPKQENRFNVLRGDLNYIVNKRDKYFFMDYNIVNCGVFSKRDFEVKGDTLGIAYGRYKGSRIWYYYVKTNITVD